MKVQNHGEWVTLAVTGASSVLPSPAAWKSKTLYLPCFLAFAARTGDRAAAAERTANTSNSTKKVRPAQIPCRFNIRQAKT